MEEFKIIPCFSKYKINKGGKVVNIKNDKECKVTNTIYNVPTVRMVSDKGIRSTRTVKGLLEIVFE